MPFWRAFYHLVWATKNWEPLITPEIEPRPYGYVIRKAAEMGAFVYEINGWTDHLHIVVAIPPHVSVSELAKGIKGTSSYALNQRGSEAHFGCSAAMECSPSACARDLMQRPTKAPEGASRGGHNRCVAGALRGKR